MKNLSKRDLHWLLRRLPYQVLTALKKRPAQVFLAGGFIRACVANETVADIDLFAPSKDVADMVGFELDGARRWMTQNATTIHMKEPNTPPIQIIHRWTYELPEELIESFDFTVAKSVVWFDGKEWQSLTHDDFYADLAAKRLVYTQPQRNEDAGGSLLRVLKFYQKGYRIPLDSMAAVIARLVVGVDMTKLDGIAAVIGGTKEQALGTVLTGLLHEVDPLQDPQHLFHLPSATDNGLQPKQT